MAVEVCVLDRPDCLRATVDLATERFSGNLFDPNRSAVAGLLLLYYDCINYNILLIMYYYCISDVLIEILLRDMEDYPEKKNQEIENLPLNVIFVILINYFNLLVQ